MGKNAGGALQGVRPLRRFSTLLVALLPLSGRGLLPPLPPRRIVSFDLDDTIWPIKPVVTQANDQVERTFGAVLGADVVQRTMKEIRVATSSRPVPLSYTELRTAAYDRLLSPSPSPSPLPSLPEEGGYSADAHAAFRCWIDARNAASEELLFGDAVECLEGFQRAGYLCVAITNGRGDPAAIPSLAPFFAFCVSGEDDGVFPHRKPSPVIFEAAIARAAERVASERETEEETEAAAAAAAAAMSCWWHVGDDATNDVLAAAACGMRTVLLDRSSSDYDGGLGGSDGGGSGRSGGAEERNPFSTASPEVLAARAAAAATARPDVTARSLVGLEATIAAFEARPPLAKTTKDNNPAALFDEGDLLPPSTSSNSNSNSNSNSRPSRSPPPLPSKGGGGNGKRAAAAEGVKLATKVEELVDELGWGVLAQTTGVRCFEPAGDPTLKSSLKFLRNVNNKWARERVEALYVKQVLRIDLDVDG